MASVSTSVVVTAISMFAVGVITGIFTKEIFIPPDDDCCPELETCEVDLDKAKGDLEKCLISIEPIIPIDSMPIVEAKALMDRYEKVWTHSIKPYKGMNIHLGHLDLIKKYSSDHSGGGHVGYRIYTGLRPPSGASSPEDDLVHLIFPVKSDGKADLTIPHVMWYDPPGHFELPCPDFCDK